MARIFDLENTWIQISAKNSNLADDRECSKETRCGTQNPSKTQPANTPDVNINNLSFFCALDAAYI